MAERVDMHEECQNEILCGQPWFRIQYAQNAAYNYWIPAAPPHLPKVLPRLELIRQLNLSETRLQYDFTLMGPAYMNLQITPMPGVELVRWTFNDNLLISDTWNGRNVYFVNFIHGVNYFYYKDYEFSLTVELAQLATVNLSYLFDIAHSAMFIHDEEHEKTKTLAFDAFLDSFPRWTNVQNWTAYYASYEF